MSEKDNNVMPLATDPHNLGEFDNVYDAMRRYPNGGVDGDYIYILGVQHFWNVNRQSWGILKDKEDNLVQMVEDFIGLFERRGYVFAGYALPDTTPVSGLDNIFYIAAKNGIYTHFGSDLKLLNEVAILRKPRRSSIWIKDSMDIPNSERIDVIDDAISRINVDIETIKSAIIGMENDLDGVHDSIDDINKDIDAFKKETSENFEEVNSDLDKVEKRLDYIPKESFLSARPAGFKPDIDLTPEITVDRAWRDHEGNVIRDTYITRMGLRNEIIDITNQQVTDLKPGSVDPDDLSEATKQLIGNKSITNLPDEEDITVTDNQTLKLKDKEYAPKDYSGMGRVYLRKHYVNGVNTLTQHMMRKPNTIYIIQYDYCLAGQTIEVPENCVLDFQGGSLRNGSLVLDNTYIVSNNACFKFGLTVSGTIANDKVLSIWFENNGDFYNQYVNIVNISNESKIPIEFKKDTYLMNYHSTGIPSIEQSVDFCFSKLVLKTYDKSSFRLSFSNSSWQNVSIEDLQDIQNAINNNNKEADVFKKYKNCVLDILSEDTEFMRSHTSVSDAIKKEEYIYIDKYGCVYNDFFNSEINVSSAQCMNCEHRSEIKNLELFIEDDYVSDDYRYVGIRIRDSANVAVSNISVTRNENNSRYIIWGVDKCYNVSLDKLNVESPTADNTSSSYGLSADYVIKFNLENVDFSNVSAIGTWGVTGTNYITDWYIDNSSISRIDTHYRLNNLTISNSCFSKLSYTGFGKILVENCEIRGSSLLLPRSDYKSFFDGDIIVQNCTVVSDSAYVFLCYFNFENFDFQADNKRTEVFGARNVYMDNILLSGNFNTLSFLRNTYVDRSDDGSILNGVKKPTNFVFKNIRCDTEKTIDVFLYLEKIYGSDICMCFENIDFFNNTSVWGLNTNYLYPNYYNTDYYYKAESDPYFCLTFENCTNLPLVIRNRNARINAYNCSISGSSPYLNYVKAFYMDKVEFNLYSCSITPKFSNYAIDIDLDSRATYRFIGCLFSSSATDEINKIINWYDLSTVGRVFSNKNNVYISGSHVDEATSAILGIASGFEAKSGKTPRKLDYFNGETLNLESKLVRDFNIIRINLHDYSTTINVPDCEKYLGKVICIIPDFVRNGHCISFNFEVSEQTCIDGFPSKIGGGYEHKMVCGLVTNDGIRNLFIQEFPHGATNTRFIYENNGYAGFLYFDTTLNKPIWWTGTNWVDASGAIV